MTERRPGAAAAEPANGPQVDALGTVIDQATDESAEGCQAGAGSPWPDPIAFFEQIRRQVETGDLFATLEAYRDDFIPRARLNLLAARIHSLGPRPLAELLDELQNGAAFANRVERYAGLAPLAHFIAALNGDHLPIPRAIRGGRR